MPSTITVDIADLKVTKEPGAELVTYSLGSCIGIAIWDPQVLIGGMLHYMLADSTISPTKAELKPAMFADTGIPLLFKSAYELGAVKERLVVKVAGGSKLFETSDNMDIGKYNYIAMRKIFWGNGVLINSEHTGGAISRTMRLNVQTGFCSIENRKMGKVGI